MEDSRPDCSGEGAPPKISPSSIGGGRRGVDGHWEGEIALSPPFGICPFGIGSVTVSLLREEVPGVGGHSNVVPRFFHAHLELGCCFFSHGAFWVSQANVRQGRALTVAGDGSPGPVRDTSPETRSTPAPPHLSPSSEPPTPLPHPSVPSACVDACGSPLVPGHRGWDPRPGEDREPPILAHGALFPQKHGKQPGWGAGGSGPCRRHEV
jgi:hypothetical protein